MRKFTMHARKRRQLTQRAENITGERVHELAERLHVAADQMEAHAEACDSPGPITRAHAGYAVAILAHYVALLPGAFADGKPYPDPPTQKQLEPFV
jgi:hypothetical protein